MHAVTDVSFDIHRGEFFGLAGESGCGKSTTRVPLIMRLLKGSATIAGGEIAFNGKNVLQFCRGWRSCGCSGGIRPAWCCRARWTT